jgi:peptidoglycan/xylan/chitin deacetylase (PgdA/CDA1 family)
MQPPTSLIALYHAIGTADATGYRDALVLEAFARQLDWLERHYAVRPLGELLRRRRAGQALDGLGAITFDDNHPSVLEQALPLLATRRLPATWALIGDVLHGRPYWRQQVQRLRKEGRVEAFLAFARKQEPAAVAGIGPESFYRDSKDPKRCRVPEIMALIERFFAGEPGDRLVRLDDLARRAPLEGITLANHSASHPVFAGLSLARQRAEIEGGAAALAQTGWPTLTVLALPFGDPGSYDAATPAALAAAGCDAVLLTADQGTAADDLAGHRPLGAKVVALSRVMLGTKTLTAFSP